MSSIYTFWCGFGSETKAALIGAIATFAVGLIGFGGLFFQIRSQGKQSRDAVAENERRRLKANMFEDAVLICREVSDTAIEISNTLRMMTVQIEYAAQAHAARLPYDLPTVRFPGLLEQYRHFTDATLKFIFLVEQRQIIDPRILIFRTAMSVIMHDTRVQLFEELVPHVFKAVPVQLPDGTFCEYVPPAMPEALSIKIICERLIDSLGDGMAYAEDFLIELQNHLLGDLFGQKAAHRKPADPTKQVITFEHADELQTWFATSTAWGIKLAQVEADAAARYSRAP